MSSMSLALNITAFDYASQRLRNIDAKLKAMASTSKDLKHNFDNLKSALTFTGVSAATTWAFAKFMKPAIGHASDLQSELIGIKTELMGGGKSAVQLGEELRKIRESAFQTQGITPFSIKEIVALEKQLVKAGASVDSVAGKSGAAAAAAALAVQEGLDPVTAGEALIGIGTPFKIASDQYMTLADTIARAASASTAGAEEIAMASKYAAPAMAALGKSTEEMAASIATMSNFGIRGEMAGTSLKNFYLQASKNKAFHDLNGNLLSTADLVEKLRKATEGMGQAERIAMLTKAFGEQGLPVALAFLNEGAGSYAEVVKAMQASVSLQDKMNERMGGFGAQLQALGGNTSSVLALLFQNALTPLTALTMKMNDFTSAIGQAAMQGEGLGKIVSSVGLGGLVLGGAATAVGAGLTAYWGRKTWMSAGGLKGILGGAAGTAAGIAKGKAVQSATGVPAVYVSNAAEIGQEVTRGSGGLGGLLKVGGLGVGGTALAVAGFVAALGTAGYALYQYEKNIKRLKDYYSQPSEQRKEMEAANEKAMRTAALESRGIKPVVNLDVSVDKDGRTVIKSDSATTNTTVGNRGSFVGQTSDGNYVFALPNSALKK